MNSALLYYRYSTDRQSLDSIELQRERCRAYCQLAGLEPIEEFSDPETSARKVPLAKREGGRALLAALDRAHHVVVMKLDRIFRNTRDGLKYVEAWRKQKIALHLADQGGNSINTATGIGEFLFTQLLAVAQLEPRLIADRVRASNLHKQANGLCCSGHPPFGFRRGEQITRQVSGKEKQSWTLVEDPDEQRILAVVSDLAAEGHNPSEIARALAERGIRGREGRKISHQLIRKILTR